MKQYLDVNLFNQIVGNSNYQTKVAQADKNLQYQAELERRAEQRALEQAKNQEATENFLNTVRQDINKFSDVDIERVKSVEEQAKQMVYQGIKENGGDVKRFFLTGGAKTLNDYKNSVLNSQEYNNALYNKNIIDAYAKDLSEGKLIKKTTVTVMQGGKEKEIQVSQPEMMQLFKDKKIKRLSYNGAEKPVDIADDYFSKKGNPNSRYEPTRVSIAELEAALIAEGQSPEIARERANKANRGDGFTNLWWGIDDFDWKGIERMYGDKNGKYSSALNKANLFAPVWQMALTGDKLSFSEQNIRHTTWEDQQGNRERKIIIGSNPLSKDVQRAALDVMGLKENVDGSWSGKLNSEMFINMNDGKGLRISPNEYDLKNVYSNIQLVKDPKTGKSIPYMIAELEIDEDKAEDLNIERSILGAWDYLDKTWEENKSAERIDASGTNDKYRIKVGFRVPTDAYSADLINTKAGIKTGQSVGSVEYEQYSGATVLAPQGAPLPMTEKYQQSNYGNPYGQYRQDKNDNVVNQLAKKYGVDPSVIFNIINKQVE